MSIVSVPFESSRALVDQNNRKNGLSIDLIEFPIEFVHVPLGQRLILFSNCIFLQTFRLCIQRFALYVSLCVFSFLWHEIKPLSDGKKRPSGMVKTPTKISFGGHMNLETKRRQIFLERSRVPALSQPSTWICLSFVRGSF